MSSKQKFILSRFTPYMGKKKVLMPLALFLSGISAALNILPYVFVWIIIRQILGSAGSLTLADIRVYAWGAFAAAFGGVLFYFCALMSSHLAAFRVEVGLQKAGMEKIRSMPLGYFDNQASGKIRKIINDGAGTTHSFLAHQMPDIAGSIVSPLILLFLTFFVDWRMGIASLIPIVIGFSTMGFMMNEQGMNFQKKYLNSMEEMSSESVEYIRGIPVVKTFGQTVYSFTRFHDSILRYKEMVLAYTLLWRKPMSFYTVVMESAAFFLTPLAVLMIGRSGGAAAILADFIFYLLIAPIFAQVLMRSMYFRQNSMIASQALDRIESLTDYPRMKYSDIPADNPADSLEFKDVRFSYDGANKAAADGVSFRVNEGETVALVGASGGGKTTLARLAARFWDTDEGEVLIGGINVKEIPKDELMDRISFVFQSTKLFKGTLRENILFGKEGVTPEEIERALVLSRSKEIIDGLKDGLDTVIGSRGTYLSGGEQQRIALARALVKDAPVILLDEATAFADPENEHLIQEALRELSRGKTTLMIAHRLTTVQNADRILVVNNGKIAESGTHDALLAQRGLYSGMWDEYQKSIAWKVAARETVTLGE